MSEPLHEPITISWEETPYGDRLIHISLSAKAMVRAKLDPIEKSILYGSRPRSYEDHLIDIQMMVRAIERSEADASPTQS